MLADERKKLIELYRGGYAAVAEALLKITDEEAARKPGPPVIAASGTLMMWSLPESAPLCG